MPCCLTHIKSVKEVDEEGEVVAEVAEHECQDDEERGDHSLTLLLRSLPPPLLLLLLDDTSGGMGEG